MSKKKYTKTESLDRFKKAFNQTVRWRHPNRPKGRYKANHKKHRPA